MGPDLYVVNPSSLLAQVTASLSDAAAARATCYSCLTTTSLGGWACGNCASKPTPAERTSCIAGATGRH
jgi:endoglucanase